MSQVGEYDDRPCIFRQSVYIEFTDGKKPTSASIVVMDDNEEGPRETEYFQRMEE
jgi:hypothetical protein